MPRPLWADRDFRILLAAQTLSALGDSFSYLALPLLVLHSTGSVTQMGLVTAVTGVASVATGVFAGVVVDRMNRRLLLVACDAARCVLSALIPLTWLIAPQVWLIYAVVAVSGVFSMIFQVAYVTVVPAIVEPGRITTANGHLYGSYAIAMVAGPMAAGLVAGRFGPPAAIAVDAATFAVSAVGVLFLRLRTPHRPAHAPTRVRAAFPTGVRFLWRHPVLRPLTILLSALTFIVYGLTDLIVYHLKHDLGRPDATVGYVLTAATAGTFAAALLVPVLRTRLGFGRSWIGAYVVAGAALSAAGLATSVPLVAALATVILFCTAVAGICSMSLRQEVTPAHLLGRVTSTFWTLHNSLGPLGAAALTALAAGHGVAPVCAAAGVTMVVVAVCGTFTPVAHAAPERP